MPHDATMSESNEDKSFKTKKRKQKRRQKSSTDDSVDERLNNEKEKEREREKEMDAAATKEDKEEHGSERKSKGKSNISPKVEETVKSEHKSADEDSDSKEVHRIKQRKEERSAEGKESSDEPARAEKGDRSGEVIDSKEVSANDAVVVALPPGAPDLAADLEVAKAYDDIDRIMRKYRVRSPPSAQERERLVEKPFVLKKTKERLHQEKEDLKAAKRAEAEAEKQRAAWKKSLKKRSSPWTGGRAQQQDTGNQLVTI